MWRVFEQLIETNAARLRELQSAIRKTLPDRNKDEKGHEAWKQACAKFHSNFDSLAFPGGLARGMSLLKKNDPEMIEQVIRFLEADPLFFRSGYLKAEFIRQLRNAALGDEQKKRLQQVIIARIHEKARREFRWYCRLAKRIATPDFKQQIETLAAPGNLKLISRQAKWVLSQITSG